MSGTFTRLPAAGLDPATGQICGYASLFGIRDSAGDVVLKGAFARSLKARGPAAIRMLWQHDPAEPIGTWLSLREDAFGLFVTGELCLGSRRAREAASLIEAGAVDGLSIGFRTVRAIAPRGRTPRQLIEVDLWEVSVVTFPALASARIGGAGTTPALAARLDAAARALSSP